MKRYVVGFMFDDAMENVVLILKNRPVWQAGLLNGVGGHIEDGEKPIMAMIREFNEEAGVLTLLTDWQYVLTLRFPYAEIEFFAGNNEACYEQAKTQTDEIIMKHHVYEVEMCGAIRNIPPLLQLSIQRLTDREGVAP